MIDRIEKAALIKRIIPNTHVFYPLVINLITNFARATRTGHWARECQKEPCRQPEQPLFLPYCGSKERYDEARYNAGCSCPIALFYWKLKINFELN